MKTDCKHMEGTISSMKEDIAETMRTKFGKVVDLDEIQEAYLKRLVFDLRMSKINVRSIYEHELKLWQVASPST